FSRSRGPSAYVAGASSSTATPTTSRSRELRWKGTVLSSGSSSDERPRPRTTIGPASLVRDIGTVRPATGTGTAGSSPWGPGWDGVGADRSGVAAAPAEA